MKPRAAVVVLVVLALVTTVSGCIGGGILTPKTWTVSANHYELWDVIRDGYLEYRPDAGYIWLAINVTLRNNTKAEKGLNWFMDAFELVSSTSNSYTTQLNYNSIPGQLPTFYPPGEVRTGYIYFHVPVELNVKTAKLLFRPYQESIATITLTNLPQMCGSSKEAIP